MGQHEIRPNRNAQRKVAQDTLVSMFNMAKATWSGFEERRSQKRVMAKLVDTLLDYRAPNEEATGKNIAVLEAGTGFGKTVGYGFPAIAAAVATGKKVVLSTATVALQEQLFERDLPRLVEVAAKVGVHVSYSLLKGRQRFICADRLDSAINGEELLEERSAKMKSDGTQSTVRLFKSLGDALVQRSWDGDRDKWPEALNDGVWQSVQADRGTCIGKRCQHYDACAYYKARANAKEADIVVANHSLVLATLAHDAQLFPAEDTIFVFDEGHHLDKVAVDHFAPSYGLEAAIKALAILSRGVGKAAAYTSDAELQRESAAFVDNCRLVSERHAEMLDVFSQDAGIQQYGLYRFPGGVLPPQLREMAEFLLPRVRDIVATGIAAMNALRSSLKDAPDAHRKRASKLMMECGPAVLRLQTVAAVWAQWAFQGKVPRAKWVEAKMDANAREITLCASALTSAGDLHSKVWSRASASIVTSATLSVQGKLDYFKRTTGLSRLPNVVEIEAPSPFNYEEQGHIEVIMTRSEPTNADAFGAELRRLYPKWVEQQRRGALALFSSRRQMQSVFDALPESHRTKILVQGDMSKGQLLAEHKRRVESGKCSIIFGLQSFGEGVDLPGPLCEAVAIDKIPFRPPGGPIDEALNEWLQTQRRDPFAEIAVPMAAQILAQWVGRAIRSVNDRARVTFFDRRLVTREYGKQLLDSLPPMPVTTCEV